MFNSVFCLLYASRKFRSWPYVGILGRKKKWDNCTVLSWNALAKRCFSRGVSAKLRVLAESLHCVRGSVLGGDGKRCDTQSNA